MDDATSTSPPKPPTPLSLLRSHYSSLGYRVHSGLQFGTDLVLYADSPSLVHSDFAVVLYNSSFDETESGGFDWRRVQSLTRNMPDLHKKLIVARVVRTEEEDWRYDVKELMVKTFHRSFKAKKQDKAVGGQKKKKKQRTK
ncbi:hypothetical protein TrLO_g10116 [Triparma laevis f. longispina]|uniref:tRNA-intron lyase n=1 Tax=Triparma laevis f. longispina TaxID=1714387 RepID=A0A9W7A964_9STRA|nr:hypothetical protein TrLO_g10116 [Triparma laevis f. longispina]